MVRPRQATESWSQSKVLIPMNRPVSGGQVSGGIGIIRT